VESKEYTISCKANIEVLHNTSTYPYHVLSTWLFDVLGEKKMKRIPAIEKSTDMHLQIEMPECEKRV
jgi:hypothetical protein